MCWVPNDWVGPTVSDGILHLSLVRLNLYTLCMPQISLTMRPPPIDPLGDASRRRLAALGSSDRLARPGIVEEAADIEIVSGIRIIESW
eukprot:8421145-Pyramimonas_sp.AAC.1